MIIHSLIYITSINHPDIIKLIEKYTSSNNIFISSSAKSALEMIKKQETVFEYKRQL
jgi:hypothetical protein